MYIHQEDQQFPLSAIQTNVLSPKTDSGRSLLLQISGLVGAAATAGLLDTRNPRILLGGAAAGAAMGVLAHVMTYKEDADRPNAMLEEMRSKD